MNRFPPLMIALLIPIAFPPGAGATDQTWRVSVDSTGVEGANSSILPAVSATGRLVAFQSLSSNLVAGDTNSSWDIFLRDRGTGSTERVSLTETGQEADGNSYNASVSDDGRFIAFESHATNLVSTEDNGQQDIYVRDRTLGTTTLISDAIGGADGHSSAPHISGDGRYVVFYSAATNLVPFDTNGFLDVFVHDLQTGLTEVVSQYLGTHGNGASWNPRISQDGQWVVFTTFASNLGFVDVNGVRDILLCDRQTSTLSRITTGPSGGFNSTSDRADVSGDGRFVVFESLATNIGLQDTNGTLDVILCDTTTGSFELLSYGSAGQANGPSRQPRISADGTRVSFSSTATNLASGDLNLSSDIFVHDRSGGSTVLVSTGSAGIGNLGSDAGDISESGDYVGFYSGATNLVPSDTNGLSDIFLRGPKLLFDLPNRIFYELDPFEFRIFPGYPPDCILVAVIAVDSQPLFRIVHMGSFTSCAYSLSGNVPSGLQGIQLDLQALVLTAGSLQWTNPVRMCFE